jgi:hypothetical protein
MVHSNLVEYVTQECFKGRKASTACRAVAKKFNATHNMFLGGDVSITAEELEDALYQDKAATARKSLAQLPDDKHAASIDNFAAYFHLDAAKLRTYL